MAKILNKALRVLLITNGLILVAGATLGPIYALFVERVGGDLMDASITFAVFSFVAGIVTFLSGRFSDEVRHSEWVVVIGYMIMGFGFLLYMFVDSIWLLFVVQAIIGFGEAVYSPAFDKLYSKHLKKDRAGTEWGVWESLNYLTLTFGALIGGVIVTRLGFDTLFFAMALMSFISAAYLANSTRIV